MEYEEIISGLRRQLANVKHETAAFRQCIDDVNIAPPPADGVHSHELQASRRTTSSFRRFNAYDFNESYQLETVHYITSVTYALKPIELIQAELQQLSFVVTPTTHFNRLTYIITGDDVDASEFRFVHDGVLCRLDTDNADKFVNCSLLWDTENYLVLSSVDGKQCVSLHRQVCDRQYGDNTVVDHTSGVRSNAMRSDLVVGDTAGNSRNLTVIRSKSGILGVSYNPEKKVFVAAMNAEYFKFLEEYNTVEEAAYARNELGKELFPNSYIDLHTPKPDNFVRCTWNSAKYSQLAEARRARNM